MLIAETGASFHRYLIAGNATIAPGPGELALKQAFWRQYITNPTVLGNYPKIKAICLFEWAKDEELTFRDFRISTDPAILAAFKEDFNVQNVKAKYLLAGAAGSPIAGTSKSAATTTTLSLLAFSLLVVLVL